MINNYILVGTIISMPVLEKTFGNIPYTLLLVEVQRTHKGNQFESDVFEVKVWRSLAIDCVNTAYVGASVSIKGRLQSFNKTKDDKVSYSHEIVVEKIHIT